MSDLRLLTASRLKTARACQELHHLEYELGYRPVQEEDTLRFGTLVHRGLEAWWLAKKDGLPIKEQLDAAIKATVGEADPYDRARAQALLTGYHFRWKDEPYEVLGVEARFETELINPTTNAPSRTWRLAGRIDAIVKDPRDGRLLIVEHKTSSEDVSPGSSYWKRLKMDGQVSVYFEGARALGFDVAACCYDVVLKPAQRPSQIPLVDEDDVKIVLDQQGQRVRTKDGKKWRQTGDTEAGYVLQTRDEAPEEFLERLMTLIAEEPNRFYARGDVVRLEKEMNDALWDIWQIGQQLRESKLAGRHPRNPDACVRWGRPCPFFDVCSGEASLEDTTRFRRIEKVNPELAGEAA